MNDLMNALMRDSMSKIRASLDRMAELAPHVIASLDYSLYVSETPWIVRTWKRLRGTEDARFSEVRRSRRRRT